MNSKQAILATAALLLLITGSVTASNDGNAGAQQFDKMIEQAKVAVQNMTDHLNHMFGLPNVNSNDNIVQALVNQTKLMNTQVQDFMTKVHTAATEKDGFLAPVIAQLNQTVNSLQTAELQKQSKKLQDTVTQSMNTIVEQIGKVATEVNKESQPNGNFYQIAANATEKFLEITKTFEAKIHETVNHKHEAS